MATTGMVADVLSRLELWQIALLVAIALASYQVYYVYSIQINLPSVGVPPGLFGPWKAGYSWINDSEMLLREGLRKYGKEGRSFKVATPARWVVVITDPEIMREIKDEEEALSFVEAAQERIQSEYTLSKELNENPYHLEIISKKLTQRLGVILPEVLEELTLTFKESTNIGPEWTSINNYQLMVKCISRTTNRLFVGTPLCRNQDFLDRIAYFSTRASRAGQKIDIFPWFLKLIVSKIVLNREEAIGKVIKYVGPIFEERRTKLRQLGEGWTDRPDDAVQWVLEAAPADATVESMCLRILLLNFASIHTSSMTITQAMLDIAAHPELQDPLKEDIEFALRKYGGWQKQALTHMKKLDSVLRESSRMNGVTIGTLMRKARVPYNLSDGTHLPKGTWLIAPSSAIHHSEMTYDNPMEFDGFRFSRMREKLGSEAKFQAVSTSEEYLVFGHGRHACPGRFFAMNEIKVLLAYIICNYEIKISDGKRPGNGFFGFGCIPAVGTEMLFRKRPDSEESPVNLYTY